MNQYTQADRVPAGSGTGTATVAAVDLGSNSFHMVVARLQDGRLHILDRIREMVQLAAGLDKRDRLTEPARARALDCLARFGQRLRGLPTGSVRAVGTNTLRRARNGRDFLEAAGAVLGHPVELVSGVEEARLIYLGVAQSTAGEGGRRLVVDIGGGSTEVIVGERFEPQRMESLYVGCVGLTRRYFPRGAITRRAMERAVLAVRMELEPVEAAIRALKWDGDALGASGTVRAAAAVVGAMGLDRTGLTRAAVNRLRDAVVDAGHVGRLDLAGLRRDRAPVFPGGVAILSALFEALDIQRMAVADGALREGLLYDLMGRLQEADLRDHTVDAVVRRFDVDAVQGRRVADTALALLEQVPPGWALRQRDCHRLLRWAAQLHELGLAVAHSGYHKHGGYLLAHADLPGFSRDEQAVLACLVRCHRRKLSRAVFEVLPPWLAAEGMKLCVLLRLAVALHRSRTGEVPDPVGLVAKESHLRLALPAGWLRAHPLTDADLHHEARQLKAAGFTLEYA